MARKKPAKNTERHQLAARLLAEDWLDDDEIAAKVGTTRQNLWLWKKDPEFKKLIEEYLKDIREQARKSALASVEHRVLKADYRWKRLHRVIEERSLDPVMQSVPGGKTGLLVRTIKGIGNGDDFQVVEEFQVDTGLLNQILNHEKQAAQELGQWEERARVVSDEGEKPRLAIPDVDDRPDSDSDAGGNGPASDPPS